MVSNIDSVHYKENYALQHDNSILLKYSLHINLFIQQFNSYVCEFFVNCI